MAPTLDTLSLATVIVAFIAAASGSLHCIVMCGPIRLLSGNSPLQRVLYQTGRIIGYLSIGGLAGYLGYSIPVWILFPMILVGFLFAFLPSAPWWSKFRSKILLMSSGSPFLLGLSSALLPCGLLHAWIGVAALSSRPLSGAFILFILWLGSLPALELSGSILWPINKLRKKFPLLVTFALLLIALVPIGIRYASIEKFPALPSGATCPLHSHK